MTVITMADITVLQEATCFERGYRLVSDARRETVDRLASPAAKYRSVGAEWLLLKTLELCGVSDPVIARDDRGKPYLVNHPDVFFNLSHSGERVMCAVSDAPVGCDVQEMLDTVDVRVARRVFTAEERWFSFDPEWFFRVWTRKESFAKAVGEGLTLSLKTIDIADRDTIEWRGQRFWFKEFDVGDDYAAAVCSLSPVKEKLMILSLG